MIENTIRKFLPDKIIRIIYSKFVLKVSIIYGYWYDRKKYSKYSDSVLLKNKSETISNIIKHYHIIEKGLTMPNTRYGFGQDKLIRVINECNIYINKFGLDDVQIKHAIQVVKEYKIFHEDANYKLEQQTQDKISFFLSHYPDLEASKQKHYSRDEYFSFKNASFKNFSESRASVRNYSDKPISKTSIEKALDLAKKAPSVCNRQGWRTHTFYNRSEISEILKIQGGNSGFGHLADKLIIVTAELSVFAHAFERNQAYIDGGIYLMNLLYALHFYEIAACPLNCANLPKKSNRLYEVCNIPKSEVFISMISCGNPPNNFKVATSVRYPYNITNTTH